MIASLLPKDIKVSLESLSEEALPGWTLFERTWAALLADHADEVVRSANTAGFSRADYSTDMTQWPSTRKSMLALPASLRHRQVGPGSPRFLLRTTLQLGTVTAS